MNPEAPPLADAAADAPAAAASPPRALYLAWAAFQRRQVSMAEPAGFDCVFLPLLVLKGPDVVANDLELHGQTRSLVVSGPNAGGKTVTLTAVGLSALMVRAKTRRRTRASACRTGTR